ncbi:MAG: hypothetical protein NXI16_02370 [Alphaproteobacteria bacterium]|nr:hypothetical protein [Alphaproteobacteria bacterium]
MDLKKDNLNSDFRNYKQEEIEVLGDYIKFVEKHASIPDVLLYNFPRVTRTQEITKLFTLLDLYKKIENVHGCIIEIGVLDAFNIIALGHISEIFEHRNYTRKIYGFENFAGYVNRVEGVDLYPEKECKPYSRDLVYESVDLFNRSITFNQMKKVEIVEGNVEDTIGPFLEENPHIVCAMLVLHISLYKPELAALKALWPRMPKGAVVMMGSLGWDSSAAHQVLQDTLGIGNIRLERLNYTTKLSYFVKE